MNIEMSNSNLFGTTNINYLGESVFVVFNGKTYSVDILDKASDDLIKKEAKRLNITAKDKKECIAKIRMAMSGIELPNKTSYCKTFFIVLLLIMFCLLIILPVIGYIYMS